MIKADMHTHSRFSFDGADVMEDMVLKALSEGLGYICFTDHCEIIPKSDEWCNYNYSAYKKEADRLNAKYGDKIKILKGVEFGEPHQYPDMFKSVLKNGYDYVLCGIHSVKGDPVALGGLSSDCNGLYYKEMLKLSQTKNVDAIAHLDYIRRGTGEDSYDETILKQIFLNMVKNDIVLEINTSGIRRTGHAPFPDPKKLALYKQCGGEKVTIGSDAHSKNEIAANFNAAEQYLKEFGFKPGVFIKRNFTYLTP